jgi:transcriptional regulator with XRE-family HTH domain
MGSTTINHKQKLLRLLGTTNWSRHHLADLLGISTFSLSRYLRGMRSPKPAHLQKIDFLYAAIIEPLECEIESLKNKAEKDILKSRMKDLSKQSDICET